MYPPETRDTILVRLADGESLNAICKDDGMPAMRTVLYWLDEDEAFLRKYVRAREIQAERMAEDILEIADDGRNDWMARNASDDAGWAFNGEHSARSRLRVESRKWLMSKLAPKKYGDKVTQELTGPAGGPVEFAQRPQLSKEEWLALHGLGRTGG